MPHSPAAAGADADTLPRVYADADTSMWSYGLAVYEQRGLLQRAVRVPARMSVMLWDSRRKTRR